MPRAYLRVDPNIDQHPDPLGMIQLLCAAARQPERGRFRDRTVAVRALGPARAKALIARSDLVQLDDGRWYVEGWDEWQEGDYTVAERMRRMRAKRASRRSQGVTHATAPPSPARNDVTTDAVAVGTDSLVSTSVGDGGEISPPPAKLGRRKSGTNPRAQGTNPRAVGTSPRQQRETDKRGGMPQSVSDLLARAAAAGRPE